ncbi:quinolinate synthase NadA [Longimicrobium sp.]|uniref:quinolinate synthase NadA n=1 Tax=Longimicrobium sp. TaxID=2029185 RepID=UPI002D077B18|nr:quinolinate synthase NadA [Longimicrobium sp.]HSU16481.1 quinolinate synthase NadA [Longimicrobium sp.]
MIQIAQKLGTLLEYSALPREELAERIAARKRELNAVILGHNYQRVEIQEVSDYLGDSLGLSQEAAATDADVIVFCGVHFMAETAKILSPAKTVLMPDLRAGCPMADFVTGDALRRLKARYPEAAVVAYVNSTAEVKAESDICCTSANAVAVVDSIPRDRTILFVPDRNLAKYTAEKTGRPYVVAGREGAGEVEPGTIVAWDGYCYVHDDLVLDELAAAKKAHPRALVVIHPEARSDLLAQADMVASTSKMVDIAEQNDEVIFGTERGIVDRLKARFPEKTLIPLSGAAICGNMKVNTLAKLAWCLDHEQHEVVLDEDVRVRAERSLRRMLDLSGGWRAPTEQEAALEDDSVRKGGCGCA